MGGDNHEENSETGSRIRAGTELQSAVQSWLPKSPACRAEARPGRGWGQSRMRVDEAPPG